MALPKRKVSKSKRDKRRTHQTVARPALSECAQCGEVKQPHQACPSCGTYRGKDVLNSDED